MAEFNDIEKALEDIVSTMKKDLRVFLERPAFLFFDRIRISFKDPTRQDEVYLWIDLGTISFCLHRKEELIDLFSWISEQLGFNICSQSLDISGDKYYVVPNGVEDHAGAQIWASRIFKEREMLFTCVLKRLSPTEEERNECPEGGAWSLWCFLVEEDEKCTVHPGQTN